VGVNRHVLTVDLRQDPAAVDAYVKHHEQVWPEVLDSLRRAGIRAMDIYLLQTRLVMVIELEAGLDVRQAFTTHMAAGPRVAEWERLMKALQQPPPGAPPGSGWTPMRPVFHFET
jgi:L-rhamnose mutarotase